MRVLCTALVLYLVSMTAVLVAKPDRLYDRKTRQYRPFGTAAGATLTPLWLVALLAAVAGVLRRVRHRLDCAELPERSGAAAVRGKERRCVGRCDRHTARRRRRLDPAGRLGAHTHRTGGRVRDPCLAADASSLVVVVAHERPARRPAAVRVPSA